MNKIIILILSMFLSSSCNDDSVARANAAEDALLTRISIDGITYLELYYDLNKNLRMLDIYQSGDYVGFFVYDYNDAGLTEIRQYNPVSQNLLGRGILTHDNFGRINRIEFCDGPDFSTDQIATLVDFEFNKSGQVISREFGWVDEPTTSRDEYTYDEKNNLVRAQRILHPDQKDEYVSLVVEYTPGEQSIPDSWRNNVFIMALSGRDDDILDMFNTSSHYKVWGNNNMLISDYTRESSAQEFDEDGNITRQTITKRNLLSPQTPADAVDVSYDYR